MGIQPRLDPAVWRSTYSIALYTHQRPYSTLAYPGRCLGCPPTVHSIKPTRAPAQAIAAQQEEFQRTGRVFGPKSAQPLNSPAVSPSRRSGGAEEEPQLAMADGADAVEEAVDEAVDPDDEHAGSSTAEEEGSESSSPVNEHAFASRIDIPLCAIQSLPV